MDKKSKEQIKEIINDILVVRSETLKIFKPKKAGPGYKLDINKMNNILENNVNESNRLIIERFDIPLIKLNKVLEKADQFQEVIEIEKEMAKIQAKKYITVKDFSEIYNISKTSQQNYRERLNDPLPYHQKVEKGKIVYVVKEIEQWFENQHK